MALLTAVSRGLLGGLLRSELAASLGIGGSLCRRDLSVSSGSTLVRPVRLLLPS